MIETKQPLASEVLKGLQVLGKYFVSSLLWLVLNPRGLVQTILQSGGQVVAQVRWLLKPKVIEPVPMTLPFNGEWQVFNGGVNKSDSHSWSIIAQRYAYDFVINGADGKTYAGEGKRLQDYLCWGQDILAPADGVVVALRNDVRDSPHVGGWIDITTPDIRGNYVILQHAPEVFSLCAHLQQGSVVLKTGQSLKRGQLLGRCGNSGHSTEPHLHFQLQDHPNFYLSVGLPVLFENVEQRDLSDKTNPACECIARGYIRKDRAVKAWANASDGTRISSPIHPSFSWVDVIIGLVIFALVLMGIFGFVRRLILLFL